MPEAHLRGAVTSLSETEFLKMSQSVIDFVSGKAAKPFENLKDGIKKLLNSPVELQDSSKGLNQVLPDIFEVRKGNQGFTEEIIYHNFDPNGIPVYGGGTETPRFRVKKDTRTKADKQITIYNAPCIVISMDGSSGSMRVISNGEFCLNHHGAVLKPYSETINLYWFIQQYEAAIKRLASNKDGSATLTMDHLNSFKIEVPTIQHRNLIGDTRKKLSEIYTNLYE